MKIESVTIKVKDEEEISTLCFDRGMWSIDGVVYPRYLKLMETISEFIRQEASMEKKFGKGEEK